MSLGMIVLRIRLRGGDSGVNAWLPACYCVVGG